MSTVDFTIEGANFSFPLLFDSPRNPFNIYMKIVSIDLCDKSGAHIMLKCLNNRGLTGFLPPPGEAHAETNTKSFIVMKKSFLRS